MADGGGGPDDVTFINDASSPPLDRPIVDDQPSVAIAVATERKPTGHRGSGEDDMDSRATNTLKRRSMAGQLGRRSILRSRAPTRRGESRSPYATSSIPVWLASQGSFWTRIAKFRVRMKGNQSPGFESPNIYEFTV
jgi:hypothetical protein